MKRLHFKENIIDFLYDKENSIIIYENNFHVFNYEKLEKISEQELIIIFKNKKLHLSGSNLILKRMTNNELLINGNFKKVEFLNE